MLDGDNNIVAVVAYAIAKFGSDNIDKRRQKN
jgi:hypothetical protein